MAKIKVFVSSSLSELESEREIAQRVLLQLKLEPVMFETLPSMDKNLENAYLDSIKDSNLFILILWKDLTEAVEKEYRIAVENHLPILLFVKTPTHRETRTPRLTNLIDASSKLNGAQSLPFRKNFRSLAELENEIKEGIMQLLSDRFTEPVVSTTNIETICQINQKMVQNAAERLLIIAKTPILILGPKPYHSVHKNKVAEQFFHALTAWIESLKVDPNKQMLYYYSAKDTFEEIKENGLEQIATANLENYKRIEEESGGRFQICSIHEFPGRIMVSDNSFGIQFRVPKEKVVYINRQDEAIASNLFEAFCGLRRISDSSLATLKKELRLP
jgi:hypothetical protein